jgi:hypothetical protein
LLAEPCHCYAGNEFPPIGIGINMLVISKQAKKVDYVKKSAQIDIVMEI